MKQSLKTMIGKIVSGDTTTRDLNAFDKFIHYQQGNSQAPTPETGDRIWSSIETNIRPKIREGFRIWLKIAASVVIMVSVGVAYYINRSTFRETKFITVTVNHGQKKTIKLADGTVVKLNSGSSLTYPEIFNARKREIELKGEAFFDVARDESKPFQITTEDITTTVLGTSFNIQSYPDDLSISVTVISGRVQLQHRNNPSHNIKFLTPGQQAIFNKESTSIIKSNVNVDKYLAWQENVLLFENARLIEVAKILERWYGVEIELEQTTGTTCLVEGSYTSETLVNVLESLKFLGVLDYKFTESRKIQIIAKSCKN
jgi:transmembrane sensor